MASEKYGTSGHGYKVYVEADPIGAPNTWTQVGGLTSDVVFDWTREFTKTTPHDVGVGGGVISNVIERGEMVMENNYIPGNAVFDGIIREHFRLNREFKMRWLGPGGSAGVDEIIQTGGITKLGGKGPNTGQRMLTWTFTPIGSYVVDGVTYE
jgi:hypothetical protein